MAGESKRKSKCAHLWDSMVQESNEERGWDRYSLDWIEAPPLLIEGDSSNPVERSPAGPASDERIQRLRDRLYQLYPMTLFEVANKILPEELVFRFKGTFWMQMELAMDCGWERQEFWELLDCASATRNVLIHQILEFVRVSMVDATFDDLMSD